MRRERWRFEVRSRRRGNVSSQTHTDAQFILSCMLYDTRPLSHPLTGVFALLASKTLTLHPRASSLPVSNSNRSVGQSEGSSGGRGGGHTKEQPMGVSTTPDCGFGTLSLLATSLLGTFPAILIVYHRGDITSHVCLIDCRLIFIHLTAALDRLAISSSQWMGQCDLCEVMPTMLCGHGVYIAVAMVSNADVRVLRGRHAADGRVKHTHIYTTLSRGSKWLQWHRKQEAVKGEESRHFLPKGRSLLTTRVENHKTAVRAFSCGIPLCLPFPRRFFPLEAGQQSSTGRAEPVGLWSRRRKRSIAQYRRQCPVGRINNEDYFGWKTT